MPSLVNILKDAPLEERQPTNGDAQKERAKSNGELKQLKTQHYRMISLHMAGMTPTEIEKETGFSRVTVYNTLQSTLGKEHIAILQAKIDAKVVDVIADMNAMIPEALKVIRDTLSNPFGKEPTKLKAALEVLKHTGHGPIEKHLHLNANVTAEDISVIKKRVREAALESAEITTILEKAAEEIEKQEADVEVEDATILQITDGDNSNG